MKKIILSLMISAILISGCSAENKAQSKFEQAYAKMQAGNVEGMKDLEALAKEYPNTKAGQAAKMAVEQFSSYQMKGFNSAAKSDLGNMVTTLESFFADNQRYPKSIQDIEKIYKPATPVPQTGDFTKYQSAAPSGAKPTSSNVKAVVLLSGDGKKYSICMFHSNGNKIYCRESENMNTVEVEKGKGIAEDLAAKGTPITELDGTQFLLRK